MGRFAVITVIVLALIAVLVGYIRLAPSDPRVWHVVPDFSANEDLAAGVKRLVETGPDGLSRMTPRMAATPRTELLAGSVESGMVTYVTRTRFMGFPDYTTVQQEGAWLKIYGRSRFGGSDWGVNRARVDAWLDGL